MIQKPHIVRFALALMLTCLMSVAAYAAPGTITLPDFSKPVLDGATQPSFATFDNVIPNALADYYTYVPYTTADAVALGFPATCGNVAKGDTASTEDCYTITVRSFQQALSLQGIFGGGPGLVGLDGITPLSTRAFGYGSGGPGWVLPYYDTTKPGVVAGTPVTGNAPAGPLNGGIWHFPAPTIKGTFGRPIRVQWLNELPNVEPTGLDPSVDCGPNAPNCFPYNRIVTHVHGAHVDPESDGLASAWFTPNFAVVGEDFVSTRQHGPEGTYRYPMDQEASTIWYHDHAMGTTHNNTNMGMAGFWPITDANEKSLQTCTPVAPATTCQSVLPTGAYELGFALQDRHFDAATGDMVMPDYPIYDRNAAGCTLTVDGLPDPLTCPLVPFMKDPADGHLVSYVAGHPWLADPINAGAPFGGTSATLEYFGNIPVVNGVVYGNYPVEPRVYRMRFIGGTDSRTWVMKLQYTDAAGVLQTVPFWQIGTEQGLLNNPLNRPEIDLMPGERVDVLVDFTGIPAGTKVMMKNIGDDAPWPGYFDYFAMNQAGTWVPSPTIPEIMAFNVGTLVGTDNVMNPSAAINLRPLSPPVPAKGFVPAISNTRVVSLMEITDGYGRTMPTIDSRGFKPVGVPVTEIIKLNDIEQWDIVNTTVDAHPMHLHQVAFKIIDRQLIDPLGFVAPTDDLVNQVFTPPSYTVAAGSVPIPADSWDDGWKDTIASPPGYVTRVWAKFDLVGEYVWHCHILSHEEHDMMRNFIVTDAAFSAPAPASITVPATSTTGSYTISWVGTAIAGVTYELQEATDAAFATAVTVQNTTAPRFTAAKTLNNSFYYRVRALPPAASGFTAGAWRTAATPVKVQLPLAVTATALTAAAVNAPYSSTTASAVNGVLPYSWSAVGLPASLTIDPATGVISGTPSPADVLAGAATSYIITVTVTDSSIPAASQAVPLNLVINQVLPAAPGALTATAASYTSVNLAWTDNANNETGFTVQRTTAVTGIIATFTTLANVTTFTDTTAVAGTSYSYSVAATNALGSSTASNTATVAVPAVLVISPVVVPAGAVNALYTATVAATGGVAPYTWSATGLPLGLTMSTAGVISGTPSPLAVPIGVSATFLVTITVQDVFTPATPVSVVINLIVNQVLPAAPTLLTAKAASMTSVTLNWVDNANNETGFSLQRATDALFTKGLITVALAANAITHTDLTVVANTTYYYRINSLNALGASLPVVALPVTTPRAALAIATTTLPNATQGLAYSVTLKATGGVVAAYSWSATGLPAGLTVAPTTGIISGVTSAPAAIYPVTVTVNDGTTALGVSRIINLTVVASKVVGAPAQPTGLTAVAVPGTISLAWVDNATTETGYTVQRSTDKNFKKGLLTTPLAANSVSYSDVSVKVVGTVYYYRVFATNGAVKSAYSNVAKVAAQ